MIGPGLSRGVLKLAVLLLALGVGGRTVAQTIQVVTEHGPFSYLSDGRVRGAATELVETALHRAGMHDFRVDLYPWARAFDQAQKAPNVLIYLIARTPERETRFKWVAELMTVQFHLYRLKQRGDLQLRRLEDARSQRIAVVRDDVRHQYLRAKGFEKLVISAQSSDNLRHLLEGRVDLLPMPWVDLRALCDSTAQDCGRLEPVLHMSELDTGLYMAFSLATPDETVQRLRLAVQQLKAEGGFKRLQAAARSKR